jgi:predicted component of type VI protein secretion system
LNITIIFPQWFQYPIIYAFLRASAALSPSAQLNRVGFLIHHLKLSSPILGDYETDSFPITVGRSSQCDFVVPNAGVSRRHATISLAGGNCTIEDSGSANGTFVEGERLEAPAALADGMRIQFGTCDFTVAIAEDSAPEAGADDPHHIKTPPPPSVHVAEDEHTELLRRPEDWDALIQSQSEAGEPAAPAPKPKPTGGFLANNWPWFIALALGLLVAGGALMFLR